MVLNNDVEITQKDFIARIDQIYKANPFDVLGPEVVEHVKLLVLCGATAQKIRDAVEQASGYKPGCPEIMEVTPFEKAVETARDRAHCGDVVTLSPACAAFDRFKNFAERGRYFKSIVMELK